MPPFDLSRALHRFKEMNGKGEIRNPSPSLSRVTGKDLETAGRRDYQLAMYLIYRKHFDEVIRSQLIHRYATLLPQYQNYISPTINPFSTVAQKLALMYIRRPTRTVKTMRAEAATIGLKDLASLKMSPELLQAGENNPSRDFQDLLDRCVEFDLALREANEYQHSVRNPVIWPYICDANGRPAAVGGSIVTADRDYEIRLRVFPPHVVEVTSSKDYRLDVLAWWDDRGCYSLSYYDSDRLERLTVWINSDGGDPQLAADIGNPIFVSSRSYQGRDVWEYSDGLPLARATINAAEGETFENRAGFLNTFKQMVTDRATYNQLAGQMVAGPGKIWQVEDGASGIDMIDLSDKDQNWLDKMKTRINMALVGENVSPLRYWGDVKTPEEFRLIQDEKATTFQRDLEIWQLVERRLWISVLALARKFKIAPASSESWRVLTSFSEPELLLDPAMRYETWEKRESLGLTNIMELLREEIPALADNAEAMAQWLGNMQFRAARVNSSRALQFKKDSPQESTQTTPAQAAEIVRGAITGPAGATGPSVIEGD